MPTGGIGALTLSGSGAYNDAKLATNFCNLDPVLKVVQLQNCTGGAIAAAKGTRLPRQPKIKVQGSARYERRIGDFAAYLQGVVFYQSSSTSNLDVYKNSLLGNTPGFASVDFSVGARRNSMTYEFFIQNAFDRRGQLSKNTFCSIEYCANSSRTFPIKPQFFGHTGGPALLTEGRLTTARAAPHRRRAPSPSGSSSRRPIRPAPAPA